MRKMILMIALTCAMAFPAVVGMVTLFAAPASAQVHSKSCGKCGKSVSDFAKVGDTCPHCHVRWGYENTTTSTAFPGTTRPSGPSASEIYAKKMGNVWRQTDQTKLVELALKDKDADIRLAAAGRLTDQKLLGRVVLESKDVDVRVIAVWKLDDPTALANVAKNDENGEVRQAATNRQAMKTQKVDLGGGVQIELVLIALGTFKMGSETGMYDQKPVHEVQITEPFYMGKYEITQEQWEKVMGSNPSSIRKPKNPISGVSWYDCQTFLGKLNVRIGGAKFSLPTEAQWEYACRAGSASAYYWGDNEGARGKYAWGNSNSGAMAHPVGEKTPNAWGLYDLAGNVWERCADWYDEKYYKSAPMLNPKSPASGESRVLRGGSWYLVNGDYLVSFRCAYRFYYTPGDRNSSVSGFRCARTP